MLIAGLVVGQAVSKTEAAAKVGMLIMAVYKGDERVLMAVSFVLDFVLFTFMTNVSMFIVLLGYKLADRGKRLVRADKRYPSSKTCSRCGKIKPMPLWKRDYDCICGLKMDRDVNVAVNIKNRGYEMYLGKCA